MCARAHRRHAAAAVCSVAALVAAPPAGAATGGVAPQVGPSAQVRAAPTPQPAPAASGARTGGVAPNAPQAPRSTPTQLPAVVAPATPVNGDIPARYRTIYRRAAKVAGLDWRVLAAIGKNESDHGRSTAQGVHSGLNFAGCCSGPMQICKVRSCGNVWQAYAVDGDRNGVRSVYDPADAVPTAALIVGGLVRMFGPRPALLLAGYNAGPGNVQRYHGVPPFKETQAYVANGLRYIARLLP